MRHRYGPAFIPPSFYPSSSFLHTFTVTDFSRLFHVLQSVVQYYNMKHSLTGYYARPFYTEVRRRDSLLNDSVLFIFLANDSTRMTYGNVYEQNTKFEIPLLDWYTFIYKKNHVTERCVFRPRTSTWENMRFKSFRTATSNRPRHLAPLAKIWCDCGLKELYYLPRM